MKLHNFTILAASLTLWAGSTPTAAAAPREAIGTHPKQQELYEPMTPFVKLAGRAWRGEGTGPDGKPIVDIALYEFILGGRAFQSTHRIENGAYGGRTIFFYDEGAKKYIYHYFTTAGFHTVGEITPTQTGFAATEEVVGHPEFIEVQSEMIIDRDEAGPILRVESSHVRKDGETSAGDVLVYREIDPKGILLFDEADALFGKRTGIKNSHDKYKDED
ncbi:hypothetical protein [Hyphococcus sp.]|uniref:hypothetical protein n=1 Tax=Hyphococcus sp. TaxID=2038636 RepID=UPI002088C168|nr:MAG: hypothetical protein DHS20C04_25570 [Marinicaulis sp.]